MKNHILNFLKGICIGIANVIPGFSGGTMAVMVKIYDLFVYAFANIFNDFKNVVKKCWSLFVGIAVGVLLALVTIVKLLEVIPFITIMFFVGLIIGSIPSIYKKASNGKIKVIDIICFILAIALMVTLPFINTNNDPSKTYNISTFIIMFLMGVICSSAMVIPGVSGSLVLMAFGYYAFFMNTFKELLINIFNFSLENYWNMLCVIACFGIGCILGIVFISKLISKLMQKHPKTVYFTILGLLIASIFSIIYSSFNEYTITLNVPTIIFSIISLTLGVTLVFVGEHMSKKLESNEN
jgi:putative membrane protein